MNAFFFLQMAPAVRGFALAILCLQFQLSLSQCTAGFTLYNDALATTKEGLSSCLQVGPVTTAKPTLVLPASGPCVAVMGRHRAVVALVGALHESCRLISRYMSLLRCLPEFAR